VLLDAIGGLFEGPAGAAHEEVDAIAGTTGLGWATALVAEPGAGAVLIIEAVAVGAAAEGAGLMAIGQLLSGEASEGTKDRRPLAEGELCDAAHRHFSCPSWAAISCNSGQL
jgi:hypothetical protein